MLFAAYTIEMMAVLIARILIKSHFPVNRFTELLEDKKLVLIPRQALVYAVPGNTAFAVIRGRISLMPVVW